MNKPLTQEPTTCTYCGVVEPMLINTPAWDSANNCWFPERVRVCSSSTCRDKVPFQPIRLGGIAR